MSARTALDSPMEAFWQPEGPFRGWHLKSTDLARTPVAVICDAGGMDVDAEGRNKGRAALMERFLDAWALWLSLYGPCASFSVVQWHKPAERMPDADTTVIGHFAEDENDDPEAVCYFDGEVWRDSERGGVALEFPPVKWCDLPHPPESGVGQ